MLFLRKERERSEGRKEAARREAKRETLRRSGVAERGESERGANFAQGQGKAIAGLPPFCVERGGGRGDAAARSAVIMARTEFPPFGL